MHTFFGSQQREQRPCPDVDSCSSSALFALNCHVVSTRFRVAGSSVLTSWSSRGMLGTRLVSGLRLVNRRCCDCTIALARPRVLSSMGQGSGRRRSFPMLWGPVSDLSPSVSQMPVSADASDATFHHHLHSCHVKSLRWITFHHRGTSRDTLVSVSLTTLVVEGGPPSVSREVPTTFHHHLRRHLPPGVLFLGRVSEPTGFEPRFSK